VRIVLVNLDLISVFGVINSAHGWKFDKNQLIKILAFIFNWNACRLLCETKTKVIEEK
jgi:hypothetical protein